jgi:hypothetical protein
VAALRWWHDGAVAAKGRRRKKGCSPGECAPFVDGEGESGAAMRLWAARWWRRPWSERGRHGRLRCSNRVAEERGPRGFDIFLELFKLTQI